MWHTPSPSHNSVYLGSRAKDFVCTVYFVFYFTPSNQIQILQKGQDFGEFWPSPPLAYLDTFTKYMWSFEKTSARHFFTWFVHGPKYKTYAHLAMTVGLSLFNWCNLNTSIIYCLILNYSTFVVKKSDDEFYFSQKYLAFFATIFIKNYAKVM